MPRGLSSATVSAAKVNSTHSAIRRRHCARTGPNPPAPGRRAGVFVISSKFDTHKASATSAAFVDVGQDSAEADSLDPNQTPPQRLPEPNQELPFTVGDIRRAIPPHCFERSALRSFGYLARDLIAIAALVYASTFIDPLPVATAIKYAILWPLYWFWVGAFGVGLWIVSHECGHGAFSDRNWLNDLVGFFGHSVLLVPYFSWKHSHRRHHANTGSVTSDEAFVPRVTSEVLDEDGVAEFYFHSTPIRLVCLTLMLVFGFPLYLLMNLGGREYKGWANHINPWSPVFEPRERLEVFLSDLGLIAVIGGLCLVGQSFGFATVLKTYIIPYFVVHVWLVLITFMHHSHPSCPHYDDKEWSWLKGAISTIDRDFGFLNIIFHRITDTHVLHHIFSQIPHYHALEATEAVKPVLGEYYKVDDRNLFKALWEDFRDTKYCAPDRKGEGVLWYRT